MLEKPTTDKKLLEAAWELEEHRHLYNEAQRIAQQLSATANAIKQANLPQTSLVNAVPSANVPKLLSDVRPRLRQFFKDLYRKKRTPATHILVFMLSESRRLKKPYAIPVQCLPYSGISDSKLRLLTNKIKLEMKERGMKAVGKRRVTHCIYTAYTTLLISVTGLVTDGEFNSLRANGQKRPVSILQIKSKARQRYAHMGEGTMKSILTIGGEL